jgi:hypothetical protein
MPSCLAALRLTTCSNLVSWAFRPWMIRTWSRQTGALDPDHSPDLTGAIFRLSSLDHKFKLFISKDEVGDEIHVFSGACGLRVDVRYTQRTVGRRDSEPRGSHSAILC